MSTYSLDKLVSFFKLATNMKITVQIYSTTYQPDDGYSYLVPYPVLYFRYNLPVIGWTYLEPRLVVDDIANSEHFDFIYNNITESVVGKSKDNFFEPFFAKENAEKAKKLILNKIGTLTEKEKKLLKEML